MRVNLSGYQTFFRLHKELMILKTAVEGDKVMQDFELESLLMGGDHSQKVKAPPIKSDYGSKDCVNLSPSTAVFRMMHRLQSEKTIKLAGTNACT